MDKTETLVSLKNLIQNLQKETSILEVQIKEMLYSIDKSEFIASQICQNTTANLITIDRIQEEFKAQYLSFMGCESFPETMIEVQDALNDKELELAFIEKYRTALKTFCSFHSKDEKCEELLAEEKKHINMSELCGMSELECIGQFGKYVDFVKVYQSTEPTDPLKLVRYVQILTPYFEAELITAAVFNKELLTLEEVVEREAAVQLSPCENIEQAKSSPIAENEDNETDIVSSNDQTIENESVEDTPETEDESFIKDDFLNALRQSIDAKHPLHVSDSKNENKTFGVKNFKNDINGLSEELRLDILRIIFKYGCAIYEVLLHTVVEDGSAIERECDYLIQKGYIKKYYTEAFPAVYFLTSRGLRAFSTRDSASYLQLRSPKKKYEDEVSRASDLVCYLLKAHALAHITTDFGDAVVSCKTSETGNSFLLCSINEKSKCQIYITILDFYGNLIENYTKVLKTYLEEQATDVRFFILGYNTAHVLKISEILNETISAYPSDTYELISNSWSESHTDIPETDTVRTKDKCDINRNESTDCANTDSNSEEFECAVDCSTSEDNTSNDRKTYDDVGNIGEPLPVLDEITAAYQQMICNDKIYCATAYLKAASLMNAEIDPLYKKLAYAMNDPLESCSYSSDSLISMFFDDSSVFNDCLTVSAVMRNYFSNHIRFDYSMQQLQPMIKRNTILNANVSLQDVVYKLFEFKYTVHSGIDRYADYRARDKVTWEEKLKATINDSKGYYQAYILGQIAEKGSHKRFIETKKLIFSRDGDIATYLKVVVDNDVDLLEVLKSFLSETFIKTDTQIDKVNIDPDKVDAFLNIYWESAIECMMVAHKTSDLMGSYHNNLFKRIQKVVSVLCDWVALMENSCIAESDEGFAQYKKLKAPLLTKMNEALCTLHTELSRIHDREKLSGYKVIIYTLEELKRKLTGDYTEAEQKYFYIAFAKNTKVLLDKECHPNVANKVRGLDMFSPLKLIAAHNEEPELTLDERMQEIICGNDDCGIATLIIHYVEATGDESVNFDDTLSLDDLLSRARATAKLRKEGFVENLELAQSYGQIENTLEDKKDKILQTVNEWYEKCNKSGNFGFFYKILDEFQRKIKEDARVRAKSIKKELQDYCSGHRGDINRERIDKIQQMIELQNYTVAEDLINRLNNDEEESPIELLENDFLQQFINSYDYNYSAVNDAGRMVSRLIATTSRAKKDTKGGKRLVENWLSNGGRLGEHKLTTLLSTMGFAVGNVQEQKWISERIETYNVLLKKPENGRKSNYKHPISPFGSRAEEEGFRVACLYGKFDADRLLDTFKEIGNTKHTLVLLDYPLTIGERRRLARKIKSDMTGKIFAVVDRVVLMFLINNYAETSINRMLMSVVMPYAYYQPYVVDSAKIMPPEIFIGRKEELNKIESPSGVNIVYGGRQLGKSALLRMAKNNINHDENGDRAVLIDIKYLDYKKAAKKIALALSDEGIFEQEVVTEDWDELSRQIKKRLNASINRIPYLLLLLDEADAFIESCESVGFRPFDALKDIQSIGSGRFKFVVAGLRNIVRFKQNIALGNNSVLTHLSSITVKPFNVMEAKELLEIPLFYLGLRFPKEKDALVSLILSNTNYFPGLLQLYCVKLIEAMKKSDYAGYNESDTPPYDVQEKHIKKVLSNSDFQKDIRDKFMITLKVGGDDYYYILALIMAYLYHTKDAKGGYLPEDMIEVGKEFSVTKILELSTNKVVALMEEMTELNVLKVTIGGKYLFTRYSFFQMMGTKDEIEDDIMNNYMEG